MNKRPIAIIIISCVLIATGAAGLIYHLSEFKARHPFYLETRLQIIPGRLDL